MPKARVSLSGSTANHSIEDRSSDTSQKKPAAIRMIILIGSCAIVKVNIAMDGPNAKKAHPKNSATVIVTLSVVYIPIFTSYREKSRIIANCRQNQNNGLNRKQSRFGAKLT